MGVNYKELKKGGFMRQKQPDYFSMRLKCVGGHFTAAQLGTIQTVATEFGKGCVHLTSRQGTAAYNRQSAEDLEKIFGGRKPGFGLRFRQAWRQFRRRS